MAYATRRSYAGAAPACTLTNSITSGDTSASLTGDVTNWTTTASGPFFMVIDPGLSTEEKVLVAARSGSSLSSITRGQDNTSAAAHTAGATCYPVFSAVDADQANKVASTLTTKGDLLATDGSVLNRLAVGTNAHVLTADSTATNGVKWAVVGDVITSSANTFTTNQIITGSSASAMLRVTQTGAGDAFVVEDETNPDATSFAITAIGDVQIGTANDLGKVNIGGTLALHSASPLLNFVDVSNTRIGYLNHDATNIILLNQVAGYVAFGTNNTERMRIDSSGQIGIGVTPSTGRNLTVGKTLTGASATFGVVVNGAIQSDSTSEVQIYRSAPSTAAAAFTLTNLINYHVAGITTPGAGSTITNQYGFYVASTMTGATNNYAFGSDLASGTGRFSLNMSGTAANYLAGRLGVGAALTSGAMAQVTNTAAADKALVVKGAASQTGNLFEVQNSAATALVVVDSAGNVCIGASTVASQSLRISKSITGGVSSFAVLGIGAILSDVTSDGIIFSSRPSTQATAFTLVNIYHFQTTGTTIGAGSTVTNQYGFAVNSGLTGATNNYGFFGEIASGANRFNLYMAGTARNYLAGGLEVVAGTTAMTAGFTHIPAAAGVPSGAPTNPTGNVPMYYDTTNNRIYVYNGAWKMIALA